MNEFIADAGFVVFDSAESVLAISVQGGAAFTRKQLDELSVGGGATGVSMVPDAGTKKTTLPNSKSQGDMNPQSVDGDQEETDPQNNSAPTGDMSAQNKATIATKGAAMKEHIDAMFNGIDAKAGSVKVDLSKLIVPGSGTLTYSGWVKTVAII